MDQRASKLHHLPLFNLVDSAALRRLENCYQVIRIRKGDIVYKSNIRFDYLIYVGSGLLRSIESGREGRIVSSVNIGPGQLIGLMYLYVKKVRHDSLQAFEDSEIWLFNIKAVEKALLGSPMAMERYCQLLIDAMHNMHKDRLMLLMERADNRILGVLAKYAIAHQQNQQQEVFLENLPTQQILADLSNTSRETVSRVLNKCFADGVLSRDGGGKIRVKNMKIFKYYL